MASEFGFRPCKIEDLKGQPKVQKMLQIYIKAAQIKRESFPHTIITGQSGCGKAQPVDTIIPTPDGDKRLGDIAVGDYVFDRLGKPTKVLGVFPQGKLDNYKVTFKDGRSTYCNDEHLYLTNDFIVTHNTTVSNVIAHELGYGFKAFSGPAINDKKVIDEILLNLKENDVLFIDEIHRISQRLQESLYFAMEQFQADVVVDGVATRVSLPHFTLIAATNLYGGLNDALLNRFPIQIKLAAYSKTDMASIVEKICQEKKIKIDEESIYKIAATTRGIPRNANSYVARVYDFALVMNDGVINPEIVDEALYVMGINKFGLNQDDMDYMNFLNSNTRAVGVDTICLTLGMDKDTVQTKIEPYLLSKCYIQKQPRGRVITDLGRKMMEECE